MRFDGKNFGVNQESSDILVGFKSRELSDGAGRRATGLAAVVSLFLRVVVLDIFRAPKEFTYRLCVFCRWCNETVRILDQGRYDGLG